MNDQFNFPTTDYDLAGDVDDVDATDEEIVELMEAVFGMSGPQVIARLLKFADTMRGALNCTEH
jgi:DNA-binding phage protein